MYTDGDLGVSVSGNMCLGPIGDVELLRVTVGKGLQIYTLADAYQGPVVLRCTL